MITVSIVKPPGLKVNIAHIKKEITQALKKHSKNSQVALAIVDKNQMYRYAKKYFKDEKEDELKAHPVLSFPTSEAKASFIYPPGKANLGEIIVSHDHASDMARKEGISLDQAVANLAVHGTLHLLGHHHD